MLSGVGDRVPVLGLNSVLGITILYSAAVIPFTIWMLRGFVAGVPVELEEAAMVDGLSRPMAFLRITFPLLAPGLVAWACTPSCRRGMSSLSQFWRCPNRVPKHCRSGCASSQCLG